MRPVKLTMSAFGPYPGKVVLEMGRLGKKGLYLITGETGAGKTTIFDAIAYALFGTASGEEREPRMFRSAFADPETLTFVELEFEYAGQTYTIRRNPDYERPKARGTGTTKQSGDAEFRCPGNRTITGIKPVNSAVQDLIGLTKEQFSQIAMIAQGDFRKLLSEDTATRQEIFRKLFKTNRYNDLQETLKAAKKSLRSDSETAGRSVEQYISQIMVDDADPLNVEVDKLKSKQIPAGEADTILATLITKDSEVDNRLKNELSVLNEQIDRLSELITRAESYEKTGKLLEENKARLAEAEEKQKESKAELEKAEADRPRADKLGEAITTISNSLPDYDLLDEKKNSVAELSEKISVTEKTAAGLRNSQQQLNDSLKSMKTELASLSDAASDIKETEFRIADLEKNSEKLDKLSDRLKIHDELSDNLKTAQNDYLEKRKDAEELRDEYSEKHRLFLDNQAGILAESLKEGSPCPVCGSTVHVRIAKKQKDAPSQNELEKLESNKNIAEKAEREASDEAGRLKTEFETVSKQLETDIADSLDCSSIDRADTAISARKLEVSQELEKLGVKLSDARKKAERQEELNGLLARSEQSLEQINSDLSESEKNLEGLKASLKETEKATAELSSKLEYSSKEEADSKISELTLEKRRIEEMLAGAKNRCDEAERNVAAIKSAIAENEKQLAGQERLDAEKLVKDREGLSAKRDGVSETSRKISSRLDSNGRIRESISTKSEELRKIEEKLKWVGALSDTANGDINGKDRITLETYVQMTYFDRIIARANVRLMKMTDGLYELKRSSERDGRTKIGLDLNVIDHGTATERNINSLSGGEQFKAALALALGQADEIQSRSGGIRLDTMFIDEGFGSLDSTSLELAMQALADLTEGNKLVGIISHVDGLKSRIDKQIVIKKNRYSGSEIQVIA